jgi:hypothetical protein
MDGRQKGSENKLPNLINTFIKVDGKERNNNPQWDDPQLGLAARTRSSLAFPVQILAKKSRLSFLADRIR